MGPWDESDSSAFVFSQKNVSKRICARNQDMICTQPCIDAHSCSIGQPESKGLSVPYHGHCDWIVDEDVGIVSVIDAKDLCIHGEEEDHHHHQQQRRRLASLHCIFSLDSILFP